jgi:hypothetical protein
MPPFELARLTSLDICISGYPDEILQEVVDMITAPNLTKFSLENWQGDPDTDRPVDINNEKFERFLSRSGMNIRKFTLINYRLEREILRSAPPPDLARVLRHIPKLDSLRVSSNYLSDAAIRFLIAGAADNSTPPAAPSLSNIHIDWMPYVKEDQLFSEPNLLLMARSRTRQYQDKGLNVLNRSMTTVPLKCLHLGIRQGLSNETLLALGELRGLGLAVTVESRVSYSVVVL